ncbi:uncharacterized protein LOC132751084 [Ruditapes philippinarum]|uniref:uncharacterized protein LOC132751084 n=1 Tax=Ruditapes philippinarum TaxID=129788 RepID=UPI00295BEE42|nr:uncharacterized protein LOC132751084 [Ruditapes philippinarum]
MKCVNRTIPKLLMPEQDLASSSPSNAYKFSTVYARGIRLFKNFLCNPKQIPAGVGEKTALKRLLNTLIDIESIKSCLKQAHSKTDCDWTLVLTQHLLRNLAVNQSFLVDDHYGAGSDSCSCCKQTICGKFGDTSIGCKSIWHGYIDLILGSEVPVVTVNEESMTGNQLADEVRSVSKFPSKRREQIIAQTIVFSFLQKKEENSYENYLIPCVGVVKNYVSFFMYDCENDILLESAQIKLMSVQGGDILETGVLALKKLNTTYD